METSEKVVHVIFDLDKIKYCRGKSRRQLQLPWWEETCNSLLWQIMEKIKMWKVIFFVHYLSLLKVSSIVCKVSLQFFL